MPKDGLQKARREWLPALLRISTAMLDSIDAEPPAPVSGQEQDAMLALSLAVSRVQGVTAWLLELAE